MSTTIAYWSADRSDIEGEALMRDMLFLSHANPEDNEFTLWLALQLASQGYPVWCDLTKLLGGEDFWKDIEHAIRDRTVKFIYILSKTSNVKTGPLQELMVAQNVARDQKLHDFIMPLHIDSLPYRESNIQLSRLNSIAFEQGWAKGLKPLLEKLEQDNVPKSPKFTPDAVTSWWRTHHSADEGVINEREEYLSNWFPIQSLPSEIYLHALTRSTIGKVEIESEEKLPYPGFQHERFLISFAKADDFKGKLGQSMLIDFSMPFPTEDYLEGTAGHGGLEIKAARQEGRDFISRLLRLGWLGFLKRRELPIYELANDARCFWFKKDFAEHDSVSFIGVEGKKTHRNMVGYKTVGTADGKGRKRFWHFGIQAKPMLYPKRAFMIKPHVLFSYNGLALFDNKDKMHAARRGQCKNWWNPEWRDRILAALTWLAAGKDVIEIPMASDVTLKFSISPLLFSSPVSYNVTDAAELSAEDEPEQEDGEEDENGAVS
jgi:TIR domain